MPGAKGSVKGGKLFKRSPEKKMDMEKMMNRDPRENLSVKKIKFTGNGKV